jgi:thiamine biosynthesis lipoprotein
MGLEKATAYWQAHSDTFDAIFLTDDQTLYVTEGIQDVFSSSYEWNVLEKGDA